MLPSLHTPTSAMLHALADQAPPEKVTVRWLLQRLNKNAFGIVILLLAVVAMLPGICVLVAFLLPIPAFEMMLGRAIPTFPSWIADRPFPTRYITASVHRATPMLVRVEKAIRPRWRFSQHVAKRLVGGIVILMAVLLVAPIPMIQVIPALILIALALAFIADDGVLLTIACVAALLALLAAATAFWGLAMGVSWIGKIF